MSSGTAQSHIPSQVLQKHRRLRKATEDALLGGRCRLRCGLPRSLATLRSLRLSRCRRCIAILGVLSWRSRVTGQCRLGIFCSRHAPVFSSFCGNGERVRVR